MQGLKEKKLIKVVFFGTGGTISGLSSDSSDVLNYKAGLVGVSDLAQSALFQGTEAADFEPVFEQIAQIDSKDMQFAIWQKLLERLVFWSKDAEVQGFVITHGTDTIEETAYFLYRATRVLKNLPTIALTCAMRPASAVDADGPQNLRDATTLALDPNWHESGVLVVCAGVVHHALNVQKVFVERLDAFSSLPAEPVGRFVRGTLVKHRNSMATDAHSQTEPESLVDDVSVLEMSIDALLKAEEWPWVEIVLNYAQNTGAVIDALLGHQKPNGQTLAGIVTAGTGMGTVSGELAIALQRAQQKGVLIWQSSKCAFAQTKTKQDANFFDFHGLSPVKARVALILHLLMRR